MRFKLNVNEEITCKRCQRASFKAVYYELSRCVYVSLNLVAIPTVTILIKFVTGPEKNFEF